MLLIAIISVHIISPVATFKSHWYYVLLSVAGGHRHGLAIARDVERFSEGRVKLWPATLYGSIEELGDLGWLEELREGARPEGSERKRFYGITRAGRAALDEETRRLTDLVKLARAVARRERA
jgi:DNA-binding PadR family transcriptional regulator